MKKIIFILMVLILSSSVYAAVFDISHEDTKNLLLIGEDAIFNINIKNEQSNADTISFVISDLDWDWEKQVFNIGSNGVVNFELNLRPPENINPGRYTLALKVYSENNPENYAYENLVVDIFAYDDLISVESLESSLPGGLDPRRSNIVKLVLKNKHNIELNDVHVKLTSELFEKELILNFDKAELKEESFDISIDEDAVEGEYDINVLIEMDDNVLVDKTLKMDVAYYTDVQEDIQESSGFLIKKINVKKINNGNSLVSESYSLRLNSFEKTFTYSNIEPSRIEKKGDGYYYIWNFNLYPGQEYIIDIKTNYRDPLFVLIVLIIIVYLIYNGLVKRVSLTKKVLTLKSAEGISEMKILLILKNRGRKTIKNIRLIDQLHHITKLPESFGSLKPTNVKKTMDGAMLIWDIEDIVGGEERVISYKVKAGVNVIGKLKIPRALCRYRKGKRAIIVKSNSILVFS